jgi:hypothetical protein
MNKTPKPASLSVAEIKVQIKQHEAEARTLDASSEEHQNIMTYIARLRMYVAANERTAAGSLKD